MKNKIGNKGYNIIEMIRLNLPAPNCFVMYNDISLLNELTEEIKIQIIKGIGLLEYKTKKIFGKNLFVSVRSSPIVSMPGMMDTFLNVGDNTNTKLKQQFNELLDKELPSDPLEQLYDCIRGVIESWNCDRAKKYRSMNNISDDLGTGIIIQEMVYGDLNDNSSSGVVFTRNPNNGEKELYGEFILKSQGDDLVSGRVIPQPLTKELCPSELLEYMNILEKHFRDIQEIEYTIEDGKLWLLQTRNGKKTDLATVKIATDMLKEGLIDNDEVKNRIKDIDLTTLKHYEIDKTNAVLLAKGLPVCRGVVSGIATFKTDAIQQNSILVRPTADTEDISGIADSCGVVALRGGQTSHISVIAREMNKVCVVGVKDLQVEEGEWITINGATGEIFKGSLDPIITELPEVSYLKNVLDTLD